MAEIITNRHLYNKIIAAILLILLLLSIVGIPNGFVSAVALEQEVRCAMEEHIHTKDCYLGNVLVCGQKAHTHTENCYLVKLSDNDINRLLDMVDDTEDHNLETMIATALPHTTEHLALAENETENANVNAATNLQSELIWNTQLYTSAIGMDTSPATPSNAVAVQNNFVNDNFVNDDFESDNETTRNVIGTTGEIATLAVTPSTGNNAANFYIYVVDEAGTGGDWECINNTIYTTGNVNNSRNMRYITASTVYSVLNDAITGANYSDTNAFQLFYSTNSQSRYQKGATGTISRNTSVFTFGNSGGGNNSSALYIRLYEAGTSSANDNKAVKFCKLTYLDENGTASSEQHVKQGTTVTITSPGDGYVWIDQKDGKTYSGGGSIQLDRSMTLKKTASVPDGTLRITFDVNFPSELADKFYDVDGKEVAKPTLAGRAETTHTANYTEKNAPVIAKDVTLRELFYTLPSTTTGETRSVYFLGWNVTVKGTTQRIEPGTSLDWDKLCELATNNIVTFQGNWEYAPDTSVTFYIAYSGDVTDVEGDIHGNVPANYTNEVFNSHLFGLPAGQYGKYGSSTDSNNPRNDNLYAIAGSKDNSVNPDERIRSLYGSGVTYDFSEEDKKQYNTTLYMKDFPTDAEVLAKIKKWVEDGTITKTLYADTGAGIKEAVPKVNGTYPTLDENHYTIRWYVFKSQYNGWHVDGRLIKKIGTIYITKTFGGNEALVEQAKEGFTITAKNEDKNETKMLVLQSSDKVADGTLGYRTYDETTDTYTWDIPDVEYGENWTITENPPEVTNAIAFSEWETVDLVHGTHNRGTGYEATVQGVTQPADITSAEWLHVDFTNLYHQNNTILIRKVDGKTGDPLTGATFTLKQDGKQMTFDYNEETKTYQYNSDGNGKVEALDVNENGFVEYINNFSYDNDDIVITETTSPENYNPIGEIRVGYLNNADANATARAETDTKTIGITNQEAAGKYAEYANGLLTVKNFSNTVSVTAEKHWDCDENYYNDLSVEVQLLADGTLPSPALLGNTNSKVELPKDNSWSYTWNDLPIYINGKEVTWSLRETKIGSEVPDDNGFFPNWTVEYDKAITESNGDDSRKITLRVHNRVKRAELRLTKTDLFGEKLSGAAFTLQEVGSETGASNTPVTTKTTDSNGECVFDNLKYETWYTLTETEAPTNYAILVKSLQLKIAVNGTVTIQNADGDVDKYVSTGTAQNITIQNANLTPLPETGGAGTTWYVQSGILLILASIALMLYKFCMGRTPYAAKYKKQ